MLNYLNSEDKKTASKCARCKQKNMDAKGKVYKNAYYSQQHQH